MEIQFFQHSLWLVFIKLNLTGIIACTPVMNSGKIFFYLTGCGLSVCLHGLCHLSLTPQDVLSTEMLIGFSTLKTLEMFVCKTFIPHAKAIRVV